MADKFYKKDGDNFVEVEDELLTSEQVNSVVKERAERIARQKYSDYDALKEKATKVDNIGKEYEDKLKEKDVAIGDLTSQLKGAQLQTDKVKIIHEFKLPDSAEKFLTGESADQLREQAEELSKFGGGKKPLEKQGKPGTGGESKNDSKAIARNLFGRNKSDD